MSYKEITGKVPSFQEDQQYHKKYWEMCIQNEILCAVIHQSILQIQSVKQRLQQRECEYHLMKKRIKHKRRKANEITKDRVCPHPECGKKYGSDTSLKAHFKFKHNS